MFGNIFLSFKWEKQQAIKENNRKGENVMLEKKWNNIAPEVPQDFHNKFEDTLKQIEQADSVIEILSSVFTSKKAYRNP